MKATDFDRKFDEDKEDIIEDLDLASARRKGTSRRLLEIGRRAASRGIKDPRSADEIADYDDDGLPR